MRLPRTLFLEITTECNLRCKQCHMWMTEETSDSISTATKLELVRAFHKMNPNGSVVISGGETMQKLEEFFAISSLCRSLGLFCAANTNATYIEEHLYERLLTEGPNYLVISWDSHINEIHDYIRGRKGTGAHIHKVLTDLIRLRNERYPDCGTHLLTNSVIFDDNILFWEEYIEFARNMGLNGVSFQILSPTFYLHGKNDCFESEEDEALATSGDTNYEDVPYLEKDKFFAKKRIAQKEVAYEIIDRLTLKYADDPFLITTKNDLEWMKLFIENPFFEGEQVCGSHEKNIMVDSYGDVQFCFSMKMLVTNKQAIGNVKTDQLSDLWNSAFAEEARQKMAECRYNCGMLNCHRKDAHASKVLV